MDKQSEPYAFSRMVLICLQVLGWIGCGICLIIGLSELKRGGVAVIVLGLVYASLLHAIVAVSLAVFDLVKGQTEGNALAREHLALVKGRATADAEMRKVRAQEALERFNKDG